MCYMFHVEHIARYIVASFKKRHIYSSSEQKLLGPHEVCIG